MTCDTGGIDLYATMEFPQSALKRVSKFGFTGSPKRSPLSTPVAWSYAAIRLTSIKKR